MRTAALFLAVCIVDFLLTGPAQYAGPWRAMQVFGVLLLAYSVFVAFFSGDRK